MTKYERLGAFLREQGKELVPMTFAEIERVVGTKLPKSQKHQAWWSNSTSNNVMTQVWLDAGYRTEQVDIAARKLVFRRVAQPAPGVQVETNMFRHAERVKPAFPPPPGTRVDRHPASGAMKGLIWIEPGYDLTRPALDPEEIEAWEAKLDRIADELEAQQASKK